MVTVSGLNRFPPYINPHADVILSTPSLSVTGAFTVTINLSKAPDSGTFVEGDISVTNGSKSLFTQVTSEQYTVLITPTSSGTVTTSVANNVFTSAGFGNTASNSLVVNYSSGGINARIFAIGGQSNVIPGGIGAGDVSSYLLPSQSYAKIWNAGTSSWDTVYAGSTVGYWPIIAFAYWLHDRYPDDELYFVQYGVGGSYLATQWGQGATYYNTLLGYWDDAIADLASTRNFLEKSMLWIQGEADSKNLTYANAYQTNMSNFKDDVRADFGLTKIIDADIYASLPAGTYPYSATVRTAKQNLVAGDANYHLLDASAWGHQSDDTHLNGSGIESLGSEAALE